MEFVFGLYIILVGIMISIATAMMVVAFINIVEDWRK